MELYLKPLPPFRLDLTVWVLRRRPHNLMDRWDGETYRRVLLVRERPVEVAIRQNGPPGRPELKVEANGLDAKVRGAGVPPANSAGAILAAILTRMLGLDIDLTEFYRFAAADPHLEDLVHNFRGVKPPRFPSPFEALANAIACQQISLTVGIHVLNRLTRAFGAPFPFGADPAHAFPRPQDLASLDPQALRDLGFSFSKARTLIGLAQTLVTGGLNLEDLAGLDDDAAVKTLSRLKGIGRWSAEYALLRGYGRTHLFPGDDVGARRKLENWLGQSEPLDYQGVRRVLADFAPFGGLLYFHFLLGQLAEEGHLKP